MKRKMKDQTMYETLEKLQNAGREIRNVIFDIIEKSKMFFCIKKLFNINGGDK